MRVLVTGGAGYVGSTLVPMLLDAGHSVVVVDRFYFGEASLDPARRAHGERLRLVRADVRSLDDAVFEGVDAVVDLAGISNDPSCDLDPELTRSINLRGAVAVGEAAQRAGVKRLVLASSCSVYGNARHTAVDEDAQPNPVSLYAQCKLEAERELLGNSRVDGTSVTALRFATLFGMSGRMRFDLAVNVMTLTAYLSRVINVTGGGKQWRPFVHVADACRAICLAMDAPADAVHARVFNVGDNAQNLTILTLAHRVRDMVDGAEVNLLPGDPDRRSYNVAFDRVQRELGFEATLTVEDGVRQVLVALKSGAVDADDRLHYTLKQYRFLAEAERVYRELSMDGSILLSSES